MVNKNDLYQLRDELRAEFKTEIQTAVTEIRTELGAKIDDAHRYMGILHEENQRKLDFIIEGIQSHPIKLENHEQRIEKLEDRVSVIEMVVKSR